MNTAKRKIGLFAVIAAGVMGCSSTPKQQPGYAQEPPKPLVWPWWPTDEPPATRRVGGAPVTNQFVLPPPLLQLPEQKAGREEIEKSGISPALVQKMLQGQILTRAEIQELAQHKVSETNIVKYLRSTGAMYSLTTKEVNELQQANVSEGVIDYLLNTPRLYRDSALLYQYLYYPPLYYPWYGGWHYYDYHHHYYHPYDHHSYWDHHHHH